MRWIKSIRVISVLIVLLGVASVAYASTQPGQESVHHRMTMLVLELAVIILFARAGGYIFSKYLKLSSVLGELCAGMLIGPFALGAFHLPFIGKLFTLTHGTMPVSPELYGIATIASIVLLFLAGLETDLSMFMRYSVAGTVVGIGGVVGSFLLGDLLAVMFGIASDFMQPAALFLGAISTATSVGITARILSEKRKLDSPEGVTILAAAVIDDVLGIVLLAVIIGVAKVSDSGVDWAAIGIIAAKAFGFWIVCTALGLLLAKKITAVLKWFKSSELIASLALGLAFLLAGLSEMAGLAMIIGAYIMGLVLSRTDVKHELHDQLYGIYQFLVPIFFCVMGMLVDFRAMKGVLVFGAVYTVVAILAKIVGCGLPALMMRFNIRGALRIGAGMLPRGEVALIIAGIGLATGIINSEVFGISIMMTLVTTVVAPPMLTKFLDGPEGIIRRPGEMESEREKKIVFEFPNQAVADFVLTRFIRAFRIEAFYVHRVDPGLSIYHLRRDDITLTMLQEESNIIIEAAPKDEQLAMFVIAEEFLELEEMFDSLKAFNDADRLGHDLIACTFETDRR
jgi:Na+:H+ antiporter